MICRLAYVMNRLHLVLRRSYIFTMALSDCSVDYRTFTKATPAPLDQKAKQLRSSLAVCVQLSFAKLVCAIHRSPQQRAVAYTGALKELQLRDSFVIATKVGNDVERDGVVVGGLNADHIASECALSLERLQVR